MPETNLPAFIKARRYSETMGVYYWVANAPCGMEVIYAEFAAITQWTAPDKIWCHHAKCDMCDAEDHTIQEHAQEKVENWFPVLACNSWLMSATRDGCDGTNHTLYPFSVTDAEDCYWWYCGNYPNGWVYWQGDWRCGKCAERTIFGKLT